MLPSWRDHLYIELYPERISLVRMSRGWQPREIVRKTIMCGETGMGEAPWAPALRALQQEVSTMGGVKANATVVLSNHFVRYALIPRGDQLSNDSEEQAYVRHYFLQTYGGDIEDWSLRLSANSDGKMQVASAVDQKLLDNLERVASACRLHLTSVQPNLMSVFNRWHRRFSGATVWFVLAEHGRLSISLLKYGSWCSLHTMKTDDGWIDRLPQLLERVLHVSGHGAERGKVYLFTQEGLEYLPLLDSGWVIHRLQDTPAVKIKPALAGVLLKGG